MRCDTCDHEETITLTVSEYESYPETCPNPKCNGTFKRVWSRKDIPYLTKQSCPSRTSTIRSMKAVPE